MGWVAKLAGLAAGLGLAAGGATGAWLRRVVDNPGPELQRRHILSIIAEESPVYFRDGVTRLGVFFADEHRDQVAFQDLPVAYVAGIVAAEDQRFWSHPGFDVLGMARAMAHNVAAGQMVAGGSTLTQQTAKNLYYRPDRSLRSKLEEARRALQLERMYSKEEILTFYANQFHVAGNGRGVGIAARHLFDKDAAQLTTVEAAMLAGMVKAPSRYDPWVGDEAQRQRAVERAHERTRYVLGRLVETSAEDLTGPRPDPADAAAVAAFEARLAVVRQVQSEAAAALRDGFTLPFQRGVFRYDSSSVLDEVARRLGEPPFAEVLAAAGIDDPAKAGLKVITTLDPAAQRAAVYGLWHHLTEVGTMLEGLGVDAFAVEGPPPPPLVRGEVVEAWTFRHATVVGVGDEGGRKVLDVDLGGALCRVDRDGLVRVAAAVQRGKVKSSSAKVPGADVDAFAEALRPGSVVWVSVRTTSPGLICDLEVRPELQGATVVLDRGEIRAMVGGNDNRNFNRVGAGRQLGSTFKTLVLHAALELGWRPDDPLDNGRNIFPFSTTFYLPRPDHTPAPVVSLAWTGTASENLATIWLLYHLLDRLDDGQLAELMAAVDLARRPDEDADAYALRVQQAGVLPTPGRVGEALFLQARRELLRAGTVPDDEALAVQSLLYGWGFDAERGRTSDATRLAALDRSWLSVVAARARCEEQYERLADAWRRGDVAAPSMVPSLTLRRVDREVEVACGPAPEGFAAPGAQELLDAGVDEGGLFSPLPRLQGVEAMRLPGGLRVGTVEALASGLQRRELEREIAGAGAPGLYDPALLYWHQDMRVLAALRYLERTARRYGVQSPLDLGLAMALGASDITIEEAARMYEGMATGQVWAFPGVAWGTQGRRDVPPPPDPTLLIAEIRDVDDNVIYRATPKATPGTRPEVAAMTADVLRNVVDHGTGRRAHHAVAVGGAALPLGGKTGTTNDFRNAAFVGYVPTVSGGEAHVDAAWTIGAYVGYDDNRRMVSGGIRLAGASGALPAWIGAAQGVAIAGLLGEERAPAGGWVVRDPEGTTRVTAAAGTGLASPDGAVSLLTLPRVVVSVDDAPRVERPVRVAPRASSQPDGRLLQNQRGVWGALKPRAKGDE